jgi:ribosomal protein S18 acetylase RimI-like enzyme
VAAALMDTALTAAAGRGAGCVWLGVNRKNQRAQQFYKKHGFTVSGNRSFQLGGHTESDYVMVRPLSVNGGAERQ